MNLYIKNSKYFILNTFYTRNSKKKMTDWTDWLTMTQTKQTVFTASVKRKMDTYLFITAKCTILSASWQQLKKIKQYNTSIPSISDVYGEYKM